MSKKVHWDTIKLDWIQENLNTDRKEPFTLQDCAKRWDVAYGTIRNYSGKHGWQEELGKRQDEKVKKALSAITSTEGEEEAVIRVRQARVARLGLQKSLEALRLVDVKELAKKPGDVVKLMQVSMEQERRALGFELYFDMTAPAPQDTSNFESVRENMDRHRKVIGLADELRDFLEQLPTDMGLKDIDGEAEDITSE